MEAPTDRERERHDRDDGDQHYGLAVTLPKGFSFRNPWITHLLAMLISGGGVTAFGRHHDPVLDDIKSDLHAYSLSNDSAHQALGIRIDSTQKALSHDERVAFNQPHRRIQ